MNFNTKPAYYATVFLAPCNNSAPVNYTFGLLTAKTVVAGETKSCRLYSTSPQDEASRNFDPKLTLFVNIPPSERGSTRKDVLRGLVSVHVMPTGEAGILGQSQMFAKWAFTHERVGELAKEASIYANELRDLQGSLVPRVLGFYVNKSSRSDDPFALLIMENCMGGVPGARDQEEYHRQYMLAACKLHDHNISHNQLASSYNNAPQSRAIVDRHVFFDSRGKLKIVDFSQATRHACGGAVLTVPGAPNAWQAMAYPVDDEGLRRPREACKELTKLESLVGDKRTGKTAIAAASDLAYRNMMQSQAAGRDMYLSRYPHYPNYYGQ